MRFQINKKSSSTVLIYFVVLFSAILLFQNCSSGFDIKTGVATSASSASSCRTCPPSVTTTTLMPGGQPGASCLINGTIIASGSGMFFYPTPVSNSCVPELRVCTNGGLSGSATSSTCTVPTHFSSATIQSTTVVLPNSANPSLYQLYSSEYFGTFLLLGGWLTANDTGPDKLYISQVPTTNAPPQTILPLHWTNSGYTDGLIPGYHANDPSVIYLPSQNWYFMYYTALSNDVVPADFTSRNLTGFASSTDGGSSWTDHGIAIGQNNGLDQTGAWSPSALLDGSGISVYYHTGTHNCSPTSCDSAIQPIRVFRTQLASNGWQQIGTQAVKDLNGSAIDIVNVNVQKALNRYWMVGNSADQKQIILLLSDDGLTFYPFDLAQGSLLNSGPKNVVTPFLRVNSANNIDLTFSYSDSSGNFSGVHRWNFQLN